MKLLFVFGFSLPLNPFCFRSRSSSFGFFFVSIFHFREFISTPTLLASILFSARLLSFTRSLDLEVWLHYSDHSNIYYYIHFLCIITCCFFFSHICSTLTLPSCVLLFGVEHSNVSDDVSWIGIYTWYFLFVVAVLSESLNLCSIAIAIAIRINTNYIFISKIEKGHMPTGYWMYARQEEKTKTTAAGAMAIANATVAI